MKINLVFDGNSLLSENNLFMPTGQTAYTWVNTVANILRYDHTVRCTNFAVAGQNIQAMIARGGLSDAAYDAPSDINILVAWEGTNQLFTTSPRASIALLSGYCKAKQTRGFKVLNGTVISRREAGSPVDFETRRSRYNDELLRTY